MVQLIRTGPGQIVNLAAVKTASFRRRGKLIDDLAPEYSPRLTLSFLRGNDLDLHGLEATRAWELMDNRAESNEELGLRVSVLIAETDQLRDQLHSMVSLIALLEPILIDTLERACQANQSVQVERTDREASPLESVIEHVCPGYPDSPPTPAFGDLNEYFYSGIGTLDVIVSDPAEDDEEATDDDCGDNPADVEIAR